MSPVEAGNSPYNRMLVVIDLQCYCSELALLSSSHLSHLFVIDQFDVALGRKRAAAIHRTTHNPNIVVANGKHHCSHKRCYTSQHHHARGTTLENTEVARMLPTDIEGQEKEPYLVRVCSYVDTVQQVTPTQARK